jgi:hypothetical protein
VHSFLVARPVTGGREAIFLEGAPEAARQCKARAADPAAARESALSPEVTRGDLVKSTSENTTRGRAFRGGPAARDRDGGAR